MTNQLAKSGRNRNGAEMYYTIHGKTTKISKKSLIQKVRGMTFCDYFDWFIETEKEGKVAKVTVDKYLLSAKHVREIAPEMLLIDLENNRQNMQFILDGYGKNHERQTTMDFRTQLGAALGFATDDGYIRGFAKNGLVIRSVEQSWTPEKRAAKKQQIKAFSATQFNKFKAYIDFKLDDILEQKPIYGRSRLKQGRSVISDQLYYVLFAVSIHTGMRFAESIGFKYSDISSKTINVNKTWNYRNTEGGYHPTKNTASIRMVTIDDTLKDLLDKYELFKERNNLPNDPEMPLLWEDGRMFNSTPNNLLRKVESKLNLPPLSLHKLRHSYASYLLYQDVSPQVIAKQLGHSDTSMLSRVYGHLLEEKKRMGEEQIRGLLA